MLYCFDSVSVEFVSSIRQFEERRYEVETQYQTAAGWEIEGA